ncbi:MAG: hypothetical protein PHD82_02045 [Candidatus Riflebacteria bacterium]|nr:hypothetical protein [Candidatus Riflebacteria bacterium]
MNNSSEPIAPKPPMREVFAVALLGLPLNIVDNAMCGLVVVLAIFLQIRFNNTLLGEGWLALFGFAGYVVMRLWLLKRRYKDPGEIVIDSAILTLPASVNAGREEVIELADCQRVIAWYFKTRGGSTNLSSLEVVTERQSYRLNWLMIDLNSLERSFARRGISVVRQAGTYERVTGSVLLIFILCLVLFLAYSLLR